MRRFEFVEGTSAKFWMAGVEGATFTVVYGRLGTDGQRKDKAFPSEDAARRELEKKINEKLREGYHEVAAPGAGATGAAPPSSGGPKARGAAAAAPRLALPPRLVPVELKASPDGARHLSAAAAALLRLHEVLQKPHRSHVAGLFARRARRALERIAGADPAAHKELAAAFDAVMAQVAAPPRSRLPLRLALPLLLELDVAAFGRALQLWQRASAAPPTVAVLAQQLDALGDPELTLRLCALLVARPDRDSSPEAAWAHRWRALKPHLEAHLVASGSTLKAYTQGLSAGAAASDRALAQRVQRLR
jgi:predicted DNA-binding WGR domain protein